jgi:phage protein D
MWLNTVPAPSEGRRPRGLVRVNDVVLPGWVEWEAEGNSFYQADTFRVQFAVSALPADHGADWWSRQQEIFVELFGGFPDDPDHFAPTDLKSELYGRVDQLDFDIVAGTIVLTGRDLTSVLIDTKTTQKWPNLTASGIATAIAVEHGLTPVVTSTTTKAGTYYEIDHVALTDERSEWDLLTWLARQEQFNVYVRGKELHFEPAASPSDTAYLLKWVPPSADAPPQFNGVSLSFSRNLTLAKGITVTVRSWHTKSKKSFSESFPRTGRSIQAGKAKPFGATQAYTYTIPNLTPEQALQKAQALHKEITDHEMRMSATLPGDAILTTRNVIQVAGTGTAFDQIYYPDSIKRVLSASGGYDMSVTSKNHSPESLAAV